MKRLPLMAAAAAALLSIATTPARAENRTTIEVSTALAWHESGTFDTRLAAFRGQLRRMRFRSGKVLEKETRALHGNGGQYGMELPGNRYLHITTREHTSDHLRLHILINENNRPFVNTYVKLCPGSPVVLGGPRYEDGTLVVTITARPWKPEDDGPDQDSPARGKDDGRKDKQPASRELEPLPPQAPAPALSAVAPAAPAN